MIRNLYIISNTLAERFFLPEISVVLLQSKLSTSMWKRLFCSCSFVLTTNKVQGREFDVPLYSSALTSTGVKICHPSPSPSIEQDMLLELIEYHYVLQWRLDFYLDFRFFSRKPEEYLLNNISNTYFCNCTCKLLTSIITELEIKRRNIIHKIWVMQGQVREIVR